MRNFPAHIPARRFRPKGESLRVQVPPKLIFCISVSSYLIFFDFMRIPEVRKLSFHFLFPCFSHIRHFFYASFRRVGRFRFSGVKR